MRFTVEQAEGNEGRWVVTCDVVPDLRVEDDNPAMAIDIAMKLVERELGRTLSRPRSLEYRRAPVSYERKAPIAVMKIGPDPAATLGKIIAVIALFVAGMAGLFLLLVSLSMRR